jgi:hypothetical protein
LDRNREAGVGGVPQKTRGPRPPENAHLGTVAKFWLSKHFH